MSEQTRFSGLTSRALDKEEVSESRALDKEEVSESKSDEMDEGSCSAEYRGEQDRRAERMRAMRSIWTAILSTTEWKSSPSIRMRVG